MNRLQIENELFKLAGYVVRAVQRVYSIAEKGKTNEKAREKVSCLESFHED